MRYSSEVHISNWILKVFDNKSIYFRIDFIFSFRDALAQSARFSHNDNEAGEREKRVRFAYVLVHLGERVGVLSDTITFLFSFFFFLFQMTLDHIFLLFALMTET